MKVLAKNEKNQMINIIYGIKNKLHIKLYDFEKNFHFYITIVGISFFLLNQILFNSINATFKIKN